MATEPDINPGALAEALNNKTDTDVQNTTDVGSAQIAHYAMPSTTFENITLGSSGQKYTAPADGWLCIGKLSSASGQYINFVVYDASGTVELFRIYTTAMGTPTYETLVAPVSKGMKVTINYSLGGNTQYFKFIYANGSEPQS